MPGTGCHVSFTMKCVEKIYIQRLHIRSSPWVEVGKLRGRASRLCRRWEVEASGMHPPLDIAYLCRLGSLGYLVVYSAHMIQLVIDRKTCLCRCRNYLRCAPQLNPFALAAVLAARSLALDSASVVDRHVDPAPLVAAASFSKQANGRKLYRGTCLQTCLRPRSRVPSSRKLIRMGIEELCHIMSCERCVPRALHSLPYSV
jgi:hypothetical protein